MSLELTSGQEFQNKTQNDFCNETLKNDLLESGFGGLFNYEDIVYAVRDDDSTDDNIVWRFKLKIASQPIGYRHSKGYRFKMIRLETIRMKTLFPGFHKRTEFRVV
jgi:hypothetical protein